MNYDFILFIYFYFFGVILLKKLFSKTKIKIELLDYSITMKIKMLNKNILHISLRNSINIFISNIFKNILYLELYNNEII